MQGSAEPQMTYAWCFSHGGMHRYRTTDGPWCTAHWVELEATTTTEALDDKERKYKHARFLDELPGEQQMEIIDATRDRG